MSTEARRHHAMALLRESIGEARANVSGILSFGIDALDDRMAA
jgi:hypothetical protein